MKKKEYMKPTLRIVSKKMRQRLLAGSGGTSAPTNVFEYNAAINEYGY